METGNTAGRPIDVNKAFNILFDLAQVSMLRNPGSDKGAYLIIGALGDNDSTLAQVGNYCRVHKTTFSEYHSLLTQNKTRLKESRPELQLDDRTRNVYGSIETLYQSLTEPEQTFVQIISFYDSSGVSFDTFRVAVENDFKDAYDLLPRDDSHQERIQTLRRTLSPNKVWEEAHIKALFDNLRSLGVVSWSPDKENPIIIDDQIRSWLQDTFTKAERGRSLHMAQVILASHANVQDIMVPSKLVAHISSIRKNKASLHPNDATAFADVLKRRRFYTKELKLRELAHAECIRHGGPEHWSTYYTSFHIAYSSFKVTFIQATDRPSTNPGVTAYIRRDGYIVKMTEDVKALETTIGNTHSMTLDCSSSLAAALSRQKMYDEAVTRLRAVLELEEEANGQESRRFLRKSASLAQMLHCQQNYEEAMTIYHRILPKMRDTLGDKDTITLRTSINCSKTLVYQKNYKEAATILQETVNVLTETVGKMNWDTIMAARELARCLINLKRWTEAEELLKWMLEAAESKYGHDCIEAVKGRELMKKISRYYEKRALNSPKGRVIAVWNFTESAVNVWTRRRRYLYFLFD